MSRYRVEVLLKSHDRKSFDCGDHQLNTFLKKNARQQIEKGIPRTFVLVEKMSQNESSHSQQSLFVKWSPNVSQRIGKRNFPK